MRSFLCYNRKRFKKAVKKLSRILKEYRIKEVFRHYVYGFKSRMLHTVKAPYLRGFHHL